MVIKYIVQQFGREIYLTDRTDTKETAIPLLAKRFEGKSHATSFILAHGIKGNIYIILDIVDNK